MLYVVALDLEGNASFATEEVGQPSKRNIDKWVYCGDGVMCYRSRDEIKLKEVLNIEIENRLTNLQNSKVLNNG